MKCRQCRQPGSPVNNLLGLLDNQECITVLSACAGYDYEGHHNLPEHPFILFSVKNLRVLDELWKKVFSRLNVPAYIVYNGSKQFLFEIEIGQNWPNRDNILTEVWSQIAERMREFKA